MSGGTFAGTMGRRELAESTNTFANPRERYGNHMSENDMVDNADSNDDVKGDDGKYEDKVGPSYLLHCTYHQVTQWAARSLDCDTNSEERRRYWVRAIVDAHHASIESLQVGNKGRLQRLVHISSARAHLDEALLHMRSKQLPAIKDGKVRQARGAFDDLETILLKMTRR
jgi:hypothetical protein